MFKIEKANSNHIFSICEIEKSSFSHPWSQQAITETLLTDNQIFLVATFENKVVGYGSFYYILDEGYINNIAIASDFRGKGISKLILDELIKNSINLKLAFLSLEVRESNFIAISLYKKFGFENVGMRKNFYQNPTENGIIMTRYFKD